jgi:hypothetical protein
MEHLRGTTNQGFTEYVHSELEEKFMKGQLDGISITATV